MTDRPIIFTIGHSTRNLEEFLSLLKQNGIDAVADVRSSPFSRHMPHFNREPLRRALVSNGIQYVFLGEELGARRQEDECYVEGVAKYELIESTKAFASGLERIRSGAHKFRVALMCSEKDPITCHRTILVGRALKNEYELRHIVSMDNVLTQSELETSLLLKWDLAHPELFEQPEDLLKRAYQKQSDVIAYAKPKDDLQTGEQFARND